MDENDENLKFDLASISVINKFTEQTGGNFMVLIYLLDSSLQIPNNITRLLYESMKN